MQGVEILTTWYRTPNQGTPRRGAGQKWPKCWHKCCVSVLPQGPMCQHLCQHSSHFGQHLCRPFLASTPASTFLEFPVLGSYLKAQQRYFSHRAVLIAIVSRTLLCLFFLWGIAQLLYNILQNGVSHRCAHVKLSTSCGMSHQGPAPSRHDLKQRATLGQS